MWRREVKPESVQCKLCAQDPTSHYFHPIGFAQNGCPVMYSCNGLAKDKSAEHNREHMIMVFEQTIRLMPPGVEQWIWFADMRGFGLRDMGPVRSHNTAITLSVRVCVACLLRVCDVCLLKWTAGSLPELPCRPAQIHKRSWVAGHYIYRLPKCTGAAVPHAGARSRAVPASRSPRRLHRAGTRALSVTRAPAHAIV